VQKDSADAGRVDERNAVGQRGIRFGICAITGRLNVFLPGKLKPASSFCSPRPTQTAFVGYTWAIEKVYDFATLTADCAKIFGFYALKKGRESD
jgi:hypothetical protein